MNTTELYKAIEEVKTRSAWSAGVKEYALELVEEFANNNTEYSDSPADKKALLNGAQDWNQYSWGGCSLIYDADIAERLCTPSELKRTDNGRLPPNRNEQWLDTQTRALTQAATLIWRTVKA
jgi:hypothetical protein